MTPTEFHRAMTLLSAAPLTAVASVSDPLIPWKLVCAVLGDVAGVVVTVETDATGQCTTSWVPRPEPVPDVCETRSCTCRGGL